MFRSVLAYLITFLRRLWKSPGSPKPETTSIILVSRYTTQDPNLPTTRTVYSGTSPTGAALILMMESVTPLKWPGDLYVSFNEN
jgi:hypothetical protein